MVSRKKFFIALLTVFCFAAFTFFLGFNFGAYSGKLGKIKYAVNSLFPLSYDSDAATEAAAKSMVQSLNDPYSEYYTKSEYSELTDALESAYHGVGITVYCDKASNLVRIIEVMPDSPAAEAGICKGDILVSVDSREVHSDSYNDVVAYIRGISDDAKSDAPMHFVVSRDSVSLNFDVSREKLALPVVTAQKLENNIFYIALFEFSEKSADDFKKAIENAKGSSALILDLRFNGGGLVDPLYDIASTILPKGLLYYTMNAKGSRRDVEIKDDDYLDIPLVVLVNSYTASAAEILTGAVQDSKRGTIIGETTYGKGLVQGVFPFNDGSGLKLTIAKYYTPSGKYINEIGLTPDVPVELTNTTAGSDNDEQVAAAVNYINENILK